MSSMSVVDNIQPIDVNKNINPQDVSKSTNKNTIEVFPKPNDMVQLSSYQDHPSVAYSDFSNGQIIEFPMDASMINDYSSTEENSNKTDQLKGFSTYFIPMYSFIKNITPDFTVPEMLQFNFTPIANFFDSILYTTSDTCASIYDTGEQAFNTTVKFVKDVGGSIFDSSIDVGKSVVSTVTDCYNNWFGSSSNNNAEIQSNSIPVVDNSVHTDEQVQNKDLKKPYWYALSKIDTDSSKVPSGKKFQDHFNELRQSLKLDNNFLFEGEHSVLQVNGERISKNSPEDMLNDFEHVLPNLESRQLISSYSNQNLFAQPYVELFSKRPELANLKLKDVNASYVVDELNDGRFQLIATSKSRLDSSYKATDGNTYDLFGIQASMILSKDKNPTIEYAYFLM
ncbi:MAG: hypothetical protein U0T60_02740 [Buchnera aphidicola (Meitanaphis microgallis)]